LKNVANHFVHVFLNVFSAHFLNLPVGSEPTMITCPSCHANVTTRTTKELGTKGVNIVKLLFSFG
jgi:hypothetical protein